MKFIILLLTHMFIWSLGIMYGQVNPQRHDDNQMDSLHGMILKQGISSVEKPENMFQLNCYNCHTNAIDLYVRHYFQGDTTLHAKDRFIHTWISTSFIDSNGGIQIYAMGINGLHDTIPVSTALMESSFEQGDSWVPIISKPIITDTTGMAILTLPSEITADKTQHKNLLIKLVNQNRYPNGKCRIILYAKTARQASVGTSAKSDSLLSRKITPMLIFITLIGILIFCLLLYKYFF